MCGKSVQYQSVWESRPSRDKFQYGMLRCLFRIRASGVRSHLCSTGAMMRKKKVGKKLKKVNIDGMCGLLSGGSI